ATSQIRRKYTNLQTDQINEQRVRYNAEAERDLQQTDLDNALNDLNLMTTAYNNERVTCQQYFLELQQCKEDLYEFLAQFRAEIEGRGIDVADAVGGPPTGRDHAKGLLRGCMRGPMLEWYDENITTKQNFELHNLLDNTAQGTIQLVAGRTAVQLGAQALREANGRAGTDIIPLRATHDPWNEDWSIADGRPTNDAVNAPNANNGTPVVVAGIRFGQAVWMLKDKSPTVEEEIRALQYGTLRQGDGTIEEFANKIRRAGRGYRDEELRRKFLDGLEPEWLEKAEDIGEDMTFNELAKKLSKIELIRMARMKRNNMRLGTSSAIKSHEQKQISSNIVSQPSTQDFQKMLQDGFNKQQELLKKQQTEHKAEIEKLKADFDTKMSQHSKIQPTQSIDQSPALPPGREYRRDEYYTNKFMDDNERRRNPNWGGDINNTLSPLPNHIQNQSARIKKLENDINMLWGGTNETRDTVNQMNNRFKNLSKGDHTTTVKSNRTSFVPLEPISKSDDQLLKLLSPAMRDKIMNPSSENKWVDSVEYIQCKIENIDIPEGGLDTLSMCNVMNKALNNALGWDLGNAPNIALTHNSDHITKLIGGHRDIPISIKYKDEQGVEHLITVTGNVVVIDDGKTDYLLCIGIPWIRKVKGIPDINKHEFQMAVRGKSYVIPTFTRPTEDINVDQPLKTHISADNDLSKYFARKKNMDQDNRVDARASEG
ncbi:6391_t:CDS:2, partial [Diversispora eburnea]